MFSTGWLKIPKTMAKWNRLFDKKSRHCAKSFLYMQKHRPLSKGPNKGEGKTCGAHFAVTMILK